jgi:Putative Flp pilus-assembly TadE/G-like
MHNLLRCRRGSAAFATVVALVPLIGAVALGGEAGSWYVTKQHAQNAADGAAMSGAFAIANSNSQPNFGTQNGSWSNVTVKLGSYSTGSGFQPGGIPPTAVQAIVTQCQDQTGLSLLVYKTSCNGKEGSVTIKAQAVASVEKLANPCVLALTGSISFQGSPNINAPNCGMASNSTANNALNFTGGGMSMNLGSLSGAGGCTGAASFCNTALTHMPPVTNPFSALDGVTMPTLPDCSLTMDPNTKIIKLVPYSAANPCANNVSKISGGSTGLTMNGGVYFISGSKLKGNQSLSGTGLLIPLGSVDLKGSSAINVTGNTSVTASQLPPALQSYASLFANMAIYDRTSTSWSIGGNSNVTFTGNMYLPNAAVTFQGNPTVNSCGELIAASIAFNGNATFNNTGCSAATQPTSQYVRLVQ